VKHRKHRGMPWSVVKARTEQRAKMRDLSRVATGGMPAPNFHTHIGRPVLDKNGNEIRIGRGKSTRVEVEYVPIFADPQATAAAMVRRAARQAALDAKRAAKAPRIAATEARRVVKRAEADRKRRTRDIEKNFARIRTETRRRRAAA